MLAAVVDSLRELDDPALTERFRQLELERRRIDAEMAAVAAEGHRRSIHVVDHRHSMAGWLKANANYSDGQCTRLRKLARLIDDLPDVGEALYAGRIGTAQADELARVRTNPRCGEQLVDSIDILLEQAEQLSFANARTCLRRWETLADLDGAHDDREASIANRSAIVTEQLEREFHVDCEERTRLHGPDAPASLLPRTDAQRRFDALQSIFRRSTTAAVDGRLPTHLVNVIVDQRTFEEVSPTTASCRSPTTSCVRACRATSVGS